MTTRRQLMTGALSIALSAAACAIAMPQTAEPQRSGVVDDARLLAAARNPQDWLTPGGRYDNAHFSALRQIDRASVARLAPRWTFHSGLRGGSETTPLVVDATPDAPAARSGTLTAIDTRSGKIRWQATTAQPLWAAS